MKTEKKNVESKGLGAWFPKAKLIKSASIPLSKSEKCSISLFYQYARPQWTKETRDKLIDYLLEQGNELSIGGRIRVAQEGVNVTISGRFDDIRSFTSQMKKFDSRVFCETDFKFIDDLPHDRAFGELKIFPVNELVFYGVSEENAPLHKGGVHLAPKEFHAKLKNSNAVVIDVRNHYEADIGRFNSSKQAAHYIDPKMRKSTDFPAWLQKEETKEALKGKEVLMYCTGGVRCERASALLKKEMGSDVDQVYQLHGGIEKYLQEFKQGGFWKGKNFVFDKRQAFGVEDFMGVAGKNVDEKNQKNKKRKRDHLKKENESSFFAKCCVCEKPWDRYIGKKKCYTCGVPVLMCDACCTKKPDKTPGLEISVRCPLCKEQNVVTPVEDLRYAQNGIGVNVQNEKTARTVCKWGGGHGKEKKKMNKFKKKMCHFGKDCNRKDCWFSHDFD